jgi:hypothetical protein
VRGLRVGNGGSRGIGVQLGLLLVFFLVRFRAVLDPGLVEFDSEEGFNAGQSWMLLQGHWKDLWSMQYRPYCGGCTAEAVLGALLLKILPRSWLVWKLVPLAVGMVGLWLGFRTLVARKGMFAGLLFAVLWIFPPWAPLGWSLVAWGNHMEAGVIGLASLIYLLEGKKVRAGLVAGLGVWFSFSGAFAALGGLGLLAYRRDKLGLGRYFLGSVGGPLIWVWSWLDSGVHPFHTIYAEDEAIPDPLRIPAKLALLVRPELLAGLFGSAPLPNGAWIGGSVLAVVLVIFAIGFSQRSVSLAYLCCWLLLFFCLGFEIRGVGPGSVPWPGALRYFGAAWPVLVFLIAEVAGGLPSRTLRIVLVLPLVLSGAVAQWRIAPGSVFVAWERDAVDWDYFRAQASFAIPEESHRQCIASDGRCREVHAYALARNLATGELRDGRSLDPAAFSRDAAAQQGVAEAAAQSVQSRPESLLIALADFPATTLAWALGQTEQGRRVDPECSSALVLDAGAPASWRWAWAFGAACPMLASDPGALGETAREGELFRRDRLRWGSDRTWPREVQEIQPTFP